ncbi:MAG: cytochrome ubiquinol oxidase subunit I [Candidatus Zixiibacteriota bacterium]|nr:MAG: cytochrome ubiquinol oxidase subunit I [candidate division Zixibacteria bacterium]
MDDPVLLARIQFALTICFHFIFPPISIGLAWLLVVIEGFGWRKSDEIYTRAGKFFGKLLAINFAIGVATGIVMEFQFGTNWAEYSKVVGDIFGAPLAAEALFAFFLESSFLGLYLFGRNRVSRGLHWFSILMVAVGSTISAFWIIVANSWQQTPTGYIFQNGRAELTSFYDAVFNPSTMVRFLHTVDAALITGAFFVAGVAAYLLLKKKGGDVARKALKVSVIFGLVVSLVELYPLGHEHAVQVAETQPEKLAAIEGLIDGRTNAPMIAFGIPSEDPLSLDMAIEIPIPGALSWLAFGDTDAYVKGLNDFPSDEIPPFWLTFVSFHTMVALGSFFIAAMLLGAILLWRKRLFETRWFLKLLLFSIPLPVIACELGWVAAEVGRQPWVVYKLLKTADAISLTVTAGEILFSIIMFSVIYIFLGALYLFLMMRTVKQGPEAVSAKEVTA